MSPSFPRITAAIFLGVGAVATALVAWNPLVVGYAKQPMSDMPATMWVMLSVLLAVGASRASAFGAGLAAGAAVITRPALLVAAAVIPLAAYRGDTARQRFAIAGAGLTLMLVVLMAIQNQLFGSPFSTANVVARLRELQEFSEPLDPERREHEDDEPPPP